MASLSELASVMSTSPAGAFRAEDTAYQQNQLQQQSLQQAKQDAAPQQSGMPGMGGKSQSGLGQMANSMLGPQYKLTTPDGDLTSAGLVNQTLMTAQTDQQNAQAKAKEAQYLRAMGQTKEAQVADMEARRYLNNAQRTQQEAQKLKTEAKDDFVSTLYGAKSQEDYDRRLKDALERTGIEPPKDFPTSWSPDMKEKLLSKMSPTMRAKIEKEDRAESAALHKEKMDNLREQRLEALLRNGGAGGEKAGKLPPTKDEREGYTARYQTIRNIDDIKSLLEDPKYAKLINPTTKFTPQLIANLQENFPELSQKLARIQSIEFQLGGKALTATEQKILEPLYGWRGLTVGALKKRISGVQSDFENRNKMEESMYPGLKGVGKKFDEIYGYDSTATKQTETTQPKPGKTPSVDAKSQAEAAIAAGAPREAVAKKYKELTGKDL
jgi:hypothetical protein